MIPLKRSSSMMLMALVLIATVTACGSSTPEIDAPTDTQTMPPSRVPTTAPSPTQTKMPTEAPSSTTSPTFTISPTRTLGTPVTYTPGPPGQCPPHVTDVPSFEPIHPSNDYSEIIKDYLNEGASFEDLTHVLNQLQFVDGNVTWEARANVFITDVTGDTIPDAVFSLLFYALDKPVDGMGYVFYCQDARYEGGAVIDLRFGASFANTNLNATIGLRDLPDANLNGIPEIVFSYLRVDDGIVSIRSGQDYARWFRVLEWNGTEFVDLLPDYIFASHELVVTNGDGSFKDTDGDGFDELILRGGALRERGHGHRFFRATTTSWEWGGYEFALDCVTATAPVYRFQAVEDGDAAMICADYVKALDSYQRAIFDESLISWSEEFRMMLPGEPVTGPTPVPDPDEQPLLSAYSRYRIMLIHLVEGRMEHAAVVYDTLVSKFPEGTIGHPYALLAKTVWDTYTDTEDLSVACEEALQEVETSEDLAPLNNRYSYFSVIYYDPGYICPFD